MNSENGAQEFDPFANEPAKKESRKSGGGVAWFALLLAIAAAGFTGYQWWLDRQSAADESGRDTALRNLQSAQQGVSDSVVALEERLARVEQSDAAADVSALNSSLDALQDRVAELGLRDADDRAAVESVGTSMLSLDQRLAAAETSIAALAARDDTPGKRMDLSEVEYLLRLASERLQLFGDPASADRSLALADERLEALEDPLYLPVRQRIAQARQDLAEVPVPDTVRLTGRIAALQSNIPSLPFPGEMPLEEPVAEEAGEEGLWARFKRTMSGLVTVRRKVSEEDILLSLEDKDYVRQGLWLQLESARLAVMRSDARSWENALGRASETLSSAFEPRAAQVAGALGEVEDLRATRIVGERPDISAPWAQLRLLREGRVELEQEAAGTPPLAVEEAAETDALDMTTEPAPLEEDDTPAGEGSG